jgi:sec-independent protein translocase protein TatB
MLNIGPMELMVILLVALIVVGPQRLPEVGRSVAKALRELRRQTDEVRSTFEATINAEDDEEDEQAQPGQPEEEKPGAGDEAAGGTG